MGSTTYILLPSLSVTFNATAALSNAGKTLTVTAGSCPLCILSNLLPGDAGLGMNFVPAATLTDAAGNAAIGSFRTNFPLF